MLQNILEKDEIIEKYDKFRKKYKLYPKQYCDEYKAVVARIEVKLQIERRIWKRNWMVPQKTKDLKLKRKYLKSMY